MILWGIFLTIIGLICMEDGSGAIYLLIGIPLFIVGVVKLSSDFSEDSYSKGIMEIKLTEIINFLNYLYENSDLEDKQNYSIQIRFYENLRLNSYRLNSEGVEQVNKMFKLTKQAIDEYKNNVLLNYDDYYEYNETCPIAVDAYKLTELRKTIQNTKDIKQLDTILATIKYLMLINEDLEVSKKGYSLYRTLEGMPKSPKKIHVEALQLLITKIYLDNNTDALYFLYNDLFSEDLFSPGVNTPLGEIKHFFNKTLKKVTNYFEKNEVEEIAPILMMVDPSFHKNYNPNKKAYEVLGLSSNATEEEIEKAYKKMLITNHPDRGGDEGKWAEINEAYIKIKNRDNNSSFVEDIKEENDKTVETMYRCDNCGAYVSKTATVCPKCGEEFENSPEYDDIPEVEELKNKKFTCDNCGTYVDEDSTICPKCGLEFVEDNNYDEYDNM